MVVCFGVDFAGAGTVACTSAGWELHFSINGQLVYPSLLPRQSLTIIGVAYSFQGTGTVKATTLLTAGEVVFHYL